MATKKSDLRPIQVLLDTGRFIELENHRPGGGNKDFFVGNDKGFAEHKKRIKGRVQDVAQGIRRNRAPGGFLQVRQREVALAKSHRPTDHLFSESNQFALVGAEHVGELLFQATPEALDRLASIIENKAELTPKLVRNKKTGAEEPRVSGYRSELGGIDEIRLHGPTDKIKFSAAEAVRWMSQPNVIGGYIVELFRPNPHINRRVVEQLVDGFRTGLNRLVGGLLIRPLLPSEPTAQFGQPGLAISIQLIREDRRVIELPFLADGRSMEMSESSLPSDMHDLQRDRTIQRHTELLDFLSGQALVRSVELPPTIESNPSSAGANLGPFILPEPADNVDYPVVAIIDGGISNKFPVGKWKVGDAGLVPKSDRDESMGLLLQV